MFLNFSPPEVLIDLCMHAILQSFFSNLTYTFDCLSLSKMNVMSTALRCFDRGQIDKGFNVKT